MSFKINDLAVSLPDFGDTSTCTTMTKPTGGACAGSIFWHAGAARQRQLADLKVQLRSAMSRT